MICQVLSILNLLIILGLEKALQSKDVINCEDKAGATLLQVAAFLGNLDAIKLLISKGANINSRDNGSISGFQIYLQ